MKKKPVAKPIVAKFDDALPEALHAVAHATDAQRVPIVRSAQPEVSPFVIKLSREEYAHHSQRTHAAMPLAQHLIIDAEDDVLPEDSAPQRMSVSKAELAHQLRELDIELDLPEFDDAVPAEADVPEELVLPLDLPATAPTLADLHGLVREANTQAPIQAAAPIIVEEVVVAEEVPIDVAPKRQRFAWRRLFIFPHHWQRALAAFVGVSFLLVMPLHAMQAVNATRGDVAAITDTGKAAIEEFARGASAFADARYALAEDEFSRAAARFAEAEAELGSMHAAIAAVVNVMPQTDRTYESVKGLITAGRELATVAAVMSDAAEDIAPATSIDIVTKLELLATAAASAAPHAQRAAEHLAMVDPRVVPVEYAARVDQLQAYAPRLSTALREFLTFSHTLSTVMGGDGAMRYMLAFQNSTELRPTGGFVGSFAEVTVDDGEITKMHVPGGGTYDVQGQLTQFVAAPSPLSLLTARWELQDANWFPDFAASARKMQWFYEHAGGPTTDGVIAINSAFVVKLLAIVGPVEMPEYGRTIDAENFMFETQKIVELEYDKEENAPKAFIGDLAPLLLERITQADMPTFLAILELVGQSLAQKDIQMYFDDNALEAAAEELGWSGTIRQTRGDYLMVVNTNLGGGKTDQVIDQDVQVDVTIAEDGRVVNTVTITKTHRGMANALFTGRNNVDYLRVYVPQGSTLLSASGFEIPSEDLFELSEIPLTTDEDLARTMSNLSQDQESGTAVWNEFGKTVFGNWMQTAPGETETVTFTYMLPFAATADDDGFWAKAKAGLGWGSVVPYTLLIQKQSGADTRQTRVHVSHPDGWSSAWESADGLTDAGVSVNNAEDAWFRVLLERP